MQELSLCALDAITRRLKQRLAGAMSANAVPAGAMVDILQAEADAEEQAQQQSQYDAALQSFADAANAGSASAGPGSSAMEL